MHRLAISVLHVSSSKQAEQFYGNMLGFEMRFSYRIDPTKDDPCYMGFCKDDAWVHVSSFPGDAVAGGVAYLVVDDVDAEHAKLKGAGVAIDLEPTDQSWSNREMYIKDVDGNTIRYVQEMQ